MHGCSTSNIQSMTQLRNSNCVQRRHVVFDLFIICTGKNATLDINGRCSQLQRVHKRRVLMGQGMQLVPPLADTLQQGYTRRSPWCLQHGKKPLVSSANTDEKQVMGKRDPTDRWCSKKALWPLHIKAHQQVEGSEQKYRPGLFQMCRAPVKPWARMEVP